MLMVELALTFFRKLFKNDTALPLYMATDKPWKRHMVSFGWFVVLEIRFPISCMMSMASSFHVPDVLIAIGV